MNTWWVLGAAWAAGGVWVASGWLAYGAEQLCRWEEENL